MTVDALPRGEAARIVREGVMAAHPWLRLHTRHVRPIPDFVTFEQMRRLVTGFLGWDALHHLRSFSLERGAVAAEVYAVNQNGSRFLAGNEVAVDTIHIPIVMED